MLSPNMAVPSANRHLLEVIIITATTITIINREMTALLTKSNTDDTSKTRRTDGRTHGRTEAAPDEQFLPRLIAGG